MVESERGHSPINEQLHKNIYDLGRFRDRKKIDLGVREGRTPLYASHNSQAKDAVAEGGELATRLMKIKSSLERINQLMIELKKLSQDEQSSATKGRRQDD